MRGENQSQEVLSQARNQAQNQAHSQVPFQAFFKGAKANHTKAEIKAVKSQKILRTRLQESPRSK